MAQKSKKWGVGGAGRGRGMGWVRHEWGLGKNNVGEYLRVGDGAGSRGIAI